MVALIVKHAPHIVVLTEIKMEGGTVRSEWLSLVSQLSLAAGAGYDVRYGLRPKPSGGVMVLRRVDVDFYPDVRAQGEDVVFLMIRALRGHGEGQTMCAVGIVGCYAAPASKAGEAVLDTVQTVSAEMLKQCKDEKFLIVAGDFNCNVGSSVTEEGIVLPSLGSVSRQRKMRDMLSGRKLGGNVGPLSLWQNDISYHEPKAGKGVTNPDAVMASSALGHVSVVTDTSWTTVSAETKGGGEYSDHVFMVYSFSGLTPIQRGNIAGRSNLRVVRKLVAPARGDVSYKSLAQRASVGAGPVESIRSVEQAVALVAQIRERQARWESEVVGGVEVSCVWCMEETSDEESGQGPGGSTGVGV